VQETVQSHGPHTAGQDDIADWYAIPMEAAATYYFESTGPGDMIGYLYSDASEDHKVAENDDISGANFNFSIAYMPEVSGTYYLKVKQLFNAAADYSLNYYYVPAPQDSWDPGDDTAGGATMLYPSTEWQTNGMHTLTFADTNDWFKFNLSSGITYRFETEVNNPLSEDTFGSLYSDSSGTVLVASDDDSGEVDNFMIEYTPTNSGLYYLKVEELYNSNASYFLEYIQGDIDADDDGDGMLDYWEVQYFGNTNEFPDANWDGDPMLNIDEYIAGTDPTNSSSYFAITNYSAGSFILEWPATDGREYRVYWAESLTNSFSQQGDPIYAPVNSYTDTTHAAEEAGFYKVDVRLP
jgi:hypothetical protein